MPLLRIASLLLIALGLGACMAIKNSVALPLLGPNKSRIGLIDNSLGDLQSHVLARATSRFSVNPECASRKVAIRNSRKAFVEDICEFKPDQSRLLGYLVSRVVYRFIDERLLRIDVQFIDEGSALDTFKQPLIERFGNTAGTSLDSTQEVEYGWGDDRDAAALRQLAASVELRVWDVQLAKRANWLAER